MFPLPMRSIPLPASSGAACLLLVGSLLVSGCSAVATPEPDTPPVAEVQQEVVKTPPTRPFKVETLYELMLAEFAGIREQIEPALEVYTIQAHETRDPGVIERAIHIAGFLRRGDVILEMAELWVTVEPDNIEVRRLLAFHLARSGRVLEAFPHGEYLLLHGDDDYLQSLAAFAQESPREEKELLLALYDNLGSQHPQNPGLLLGRAMLLRQLERLDEALTSTRQLVALEPGNETAQLLQAQLQHAMGDEAAALKSLERALSQLPESKRLRLQYARFLSEKDLVSSREQIAILAEQYPRDSNILFSLGLASRELGMLDEASATFSTLISLNRRTSDARFQLGRIAEDRGQPEEAVYQYRQVSDGQSLLTAAMRTAEILAAHNNLSAAREHLATMRATYPAVSENLFQMEAELLIRQKRYNETYDLLTTALQAEPESPNLLYTRSIVSAKQKDLRAAEDDLRAILARDENNSTALNALGYTIAILSDRLDEALALISRANDLEPGNPAILDSLGWVHYLQGNVERALPYLRQAFEAFPDGEVAAHLGEALWSKGLQQEAESVWLRGLENSPNDETLLETLERLAPGRKQVLLDSADANRTPAAIPQ